MTDDAEYLRDRAEVQFEVPVPQNYQYCVQLYDKMVDGSQHLTAEQTGSVPMVVWEGFLTKLITEEMGFSVPYYTSLRNHLIRMECMRQMRRGGGSTPSQWEMLRPPTEELWHSMAPKRSQSHTKQDQTAGQVGDLHKRLEILEDQMQVLISALTTGNAKVPFDEPKREGAGPKQYEQRGA